MKNRGLALTALLFAATLAAHVSTAQAQTTVIPLWPHGAPEPPQTTAPEIDTTKPTDALFNGKRSQRLTNVSVPTLSVYSPPSAHDTHVAALVFPGGGYVRLAWEGEGVNTCDWLTHIGVTCLLVKYRVPQPSGEAGHYPADPADLEDAQQAMRLARSHAAEWHINPDRIGVIGYSAGGNLAVLLSTHPDDVHVLSTPAAPDVPTINGSPRSAKPDFAIIGYPAYLAVPPSEASLDAVYTPNQFTPPTFLIQAENDKTYGHNALVYYRALMDAKVPAELHYFATGGHGFGVDPPNTPEEHWTHLATFWMHTTGILPSEPPQPHSTNGAPGTTPSQPCTLDAQQPPPAGRPVKPNPNNTDNPCPQ